MDLSMQRPILYRYENDVFIDKFFKNGKLLISTFHNYKSYPDNQIGDIFEGISETLETHVDKESLKLFAHSHSMTGENAYCFCTSTILDPALFGEFKRNSVFRITNAYCFMDEICKALKLSEVLSGHCEYLRLRIPKQKIANIGIGFVPTNNLESSETFPIANLYDNNEMLFIKRIKYQLQCEYRMIWKTDHTVKDPIEIDCHKASQFCEMISEDELNDVKSQLAQARKDR
jgi:hypothetical protein